MAPDDLVEIRLPPAKPDLYLRWVAFTRAVVERLEMHQPFREAEAKLPSAVLGSQVFENEVVPAAAREAEVAEQEHRIAMPVVQISRGSARSIMEAILIRAEWLGLYEGVDRLDLLGIPQPDDEMMDLYLRAVSAIRDVAFGAA